MFLIVRCRESGTNMPKEHKPLKQKTAEAESGQAFSKLVSSTFQHIKEPEGLARQPDSPLFMYLISILSAYLPKAANKGDFYVMKNNVKIIL